VSGYKNGSTYITDSVQLQNTGTCTSFLANYNYTNCGFTGNDAYRCVMDPDPVADSDNEQGFCRFLMVYEARYDGDADPATDDDRVFLVAHAQHVDGQWERYLPRASGYPTTSDIRVQNTSRHNQDASANLYSFVSVPTLHYDDTDGLWRMWFVTEDKGRHSVRYSESDDNGLSWGVGSWPGTTRSTTGIVVDGDRANCGSESVMDPEIVKYEGGWLAFFNGPGGIHLAASAFPCSNFVDDDADGDTDWAVYGGADAGCSSPWDTTE